MSASRFTVACWTLGSAVLDENGEGELSCWLDRPQDQNTVPAPNTSAPLVGSRYSTKLLVAVPDVSMLPQFVLNSVSSSIVVVERSTSPAGWYPLSGDEFPLIAEQVRLEGRRAARRGLSRRRYCARIAGSFRHMGW